MRELYLYSQDQTYYRLSHEGRTDAEIAQTLRAARLNPGEWTKSGVTEIRYVPPTETSDYDDARYVIR